MSTKQCEQDIIAYLVNRCAIRPEKIRTNSSLPEDLGVDDEDALDFLVWYQDHFKQRLPPDVLSAMLDGPPPAFLWVLFDILRPGEGFRKHRLRFFETRRGVTVGTLAQFAHDPKQGIPLGQVPVTMASPVIRTTMQVVMLWAFFLIVAQFQTSWNGFSDTAKISAVLTAVIWIVVQPLGYWAMRRWQSRFRDAMERTAKLKGAP